MFVARVRLHRWGGFLGSHSITCLKWLTPFYVWGCDVGSELCAISYYSVDEVFWNFKRWGQRSRFCFLVTIICNCAHSGRIGKFCLPIYRTLYYYIYVFFFIFTIANEKILSILLMLPRPLSSPFPKIFCVHLFFVNSYQEYK